MPITESTATALVRFTGMGIIKFCDTTNRGELLIVRDDKHTFRVKIQQPIYKDGLERDVIVYEDMAVYENLPMTNVEISITTGGQTTVSGFEVYRGGNFDRLLSDDVNDFNWVVNMEQLHGANLVESVSLTANPTNDIFIENGFFYTHKLDTDLYFEKVTKDANGTEISRENFGNVAKTIGVKLEADEVVFSIKAGVINEMHTLSHVNGLPFRIEIENIDYNVNAIYSDMPDYYKYYSITDNTFFEFEPLKSNEDDNSISGGSVNSEAFCHPVEGSC